MLAKHTIYTALKALQDQAFPSAHQQMPVPHICATAGKGVGVPAPHPVPAPGSIPWHQEQEAPLRPWGCVLERKIPVR